MRIFELILVVVLALVPAHGQRHRLRRHVKFETERTDPTLLPYNGTYDLPPEAPWSGALLQSASDAAGRRLATTENYLLEIRNNLNDGDVIKIVHQKIPGSVWNCGSQLRVTGNSFSRHFTLTVQDSGPYYCYLDGVQITGKNYVDVSVKTLHPQIVDMLLSTSWTGAVELDWDYMGHRRFAVSMITSLGRGLVQALCPSASQEQVCFSYFESQEALPAVDTDMDVETFLDLQDAVFGVPYDGNRRLCPLVIAGIAVAVELGAEYIIVEMGATVAAAVVGAEVTQVGAGVYRVAKTATTAVKNFRTYQAWRFVIPVTDNYGAKVVIKTIGEKVTKASIRTTSQVKRIACPGALCTRWRMVERGGKRTFDTAVMRKTADAGDITIDLTRDTQDLFGVVLESITNGAGVA